ncbi:hypothetical protein SAMN05444004_105111 [Jannaschia faecimaris]|uniref:Uncharacterized protein n=1 Tax=Jannaschia faecimaris TaxID=1244108 RepID=A0A1H3PQE6_9RHOB|nr:hypothetical protein [Jannaschia faecimaris]SDZ03276.1 hypothetical protein SAMN05444004_105111 [Jannaschia faecimaris]
MMLVVFLAVQALIFAAWAIVSLSILLGIFGRAVSSDPDLQEVDAQAGAVRNYLSDPVNQFRRRVWLGLTPALLICAAISGIVFTRL